MSAFTRALLLAPLLGSCGALAPGAIAPGGDAPAPTAAAQPGDPTQAEVALPCADGWRASLVLDNAPTGVWTVKALQVFDDLACPEIVGLDDMGRCWIMVSYSGKWTPVRTIEEKKWLGGLAQGDVDPRIDGNELYTGGEKGNLYQVLAYDGSLTDHRMIARFPGQEIHTLVVGDLDPRSDGSEILVFTRPGGLYRVTPTGAHGTFESTLLQPLEGRVRDALVLPGAGGGAPEIATVSRAGKVELLRIGADGPVWTTVHSAPMGFGRIALAPPRPGAATVLYSVQDDGIVLRHERAAQAWTTETIFLGPQGMRGLTAGRFDADPAVETVAVFGYSGRVQLLSRRAGEAWTVETIFEDRDKGHWLAAGELDGRNATDEIIGSGYGARIFQLARPPGHGRPDLPVDDRGAAREAAAARPLRVAVRAEPAAAASASPLSYRGGFEPKTLVYETLVTRDARGELAPGLASAWRFEDEGRRVVLTIRPDARFHDGTRVDAGALAVHFRRWVGLPEHGWLGASRHIRDVRAIAPDELAIAMDEPYAILADLCAINPCSIQGPGTLDREGEFVRPIGSGPLRFVGASEDGRTLRYARAGEEREAAAVDVVPFGAGGRPLDALLAGEVDVVFDGWSECVPRARLADLGQDARFDVRDVPGSSVRYLSFRMEGPSADPALRRAVAAAVDRDELVRRVEGGLADACTTWAAPSVSAWPAPRASPASEASAAPATDGRALRLLARADDPREPALAAVLSEQLERAGLRVETELVDGAQHAARLADGAYDLRLEETWGVPYDPELSLRARFLPPAAEPNASTRHPLGLDPALTQLVLASTREPSDERRRELFARVQQRMDEAALVVPLYVPRRVSVVRSGLAHPELGIDLYRVDLTALTRPASFRAGS